MDYWEVVHQAIQLNSVNERDMFMMQGLKNLGIERGKPLEPAAEQVAILEDAALVGDLGVDNIARQQIGSDPPEYTRLGEELR
jgi:hypothetical protein